MFRRSQPLAIMVSLVFLFSPLALVVVSPVAHATPVTVDEFEGGISVANLTFMSWPENGTLAVRLPRGATVLDASVTLEGRAGTRTVTKTMDFVNGVIGKDLWAAHKGDAGIYPPTVNPYKSGWNGANQKEYATLGKNDRMWWVTTTTAQGIPPPDPPLEWPIQLYHFNPGITNVSTMDIAWIGHGWCGNNQTTPGHAELWLYNHTSSEWDQVANYSSKQASDFTLKHTAYAPTSYVSTNGSIEALVVGAHSETLGGRVAQGTLETEYIELKVVSAPITEHPYDVVLELGGRNVTAHYEYLKGELVVDGAVLAPALQRVIDGATVMPGDLVIPFNVSVGNVTTASIQVRDLLIEYEPVVNLPPEWTGPGEVSVDEDATWTDVVDLGAAFLDDHNAGALTFQVLSVSNDANLSARIGWSGVNRSLEVMGAHDFFGDVSVIVRATDLFGASVDSADIIVHVLQKADTPMLVDPGSLSVLEGDTLRHTFDVVDPDLPDDQFTFADSSDWVDIDPSTGEIVWTPDQTQVGSHKFVVSVEDRFGLTATLNVNIVVTDVNQPPAITSTLEASGVQDELLRYTIRASDPDLQFGDVLVFEAFTDGLKISIDGGTGVMSLTPTNAQVPRMEITLRVTDRLGLRDEAILVVNVENRNDPPVLAPMGPLTFDQGEEVSVQLVVTDPDLGLDIPTPEVLTFETTGPAAFAADADGLVAFVADQSLVGKHSVIYIVTDRAGARSSITIVWNIDDINDAPVVTTDVSAGASADEDTPFELKLAATDADGDFLEWSDDSPLFDIDPATGRIAFTPTQEDVGTYTVTVTVTDGRGGHEEVTFDLQVVNVNDAPVITGVLPDSGIRVKQGKGIFLSCTATDEDGDDLTYTWRDGDKLLGTGRDLSDIKLASGVRTVTVVVDDGTSSTTGTIVITVEKAEEQPGFGSLVAVSALCLALAAVGGGRRRR